MMQRFAVPLFSVFVLLFQLFCVPVSFAQSPKAQLQMVEKDVNDVRRHFDKLHRQVARLQARQVRVCIGSGREDEVICKEDLETILKPLRDQLETLEDDVEDNDLAISQLRTDLTTATNNLTTITTKVETLTGDLKDLQEQVMARRWHFEFSTGSGANLLVTHGVSGTLETGIQFTYETDRLGGTARAGATFTPYLGVAGGEGSIAVFHRFADGKLGIGAMFGGLIRDYGIVGTVHDQRIYGPMAAGHIRWTLIDEGFSIDLVAQPGSFVGVHTLSPSITGTPEGSRGVGVVPFARVLFDVGILIAD